MLSLFLYLFPISRDFILKADILCFRLLNNSLGSNQCWDTLWMWMNHKYETKVNILLALCFNFYLIFRYKQRKYITELIIMALSLEAYVLSSNYLFHKYLAIGRHSPSLVFEDYISLREMWGNMNVKDQSTGSFPGGHAAALSYWAFYTATFAPKKYAKYIITYSIFISLGRLFAGAHWMTDVIFAYILSYAFIALLFWLRRTASAKLKMENEGIY